jgi:hypothetical protein
LASAAGRRCDAAPRTANAPIAVTLQAQLWNQVLAVLSDAPYRAVAVIIGRITEQANAAAAAGAVASNPPNGRDEPRRSSLKGDLNR